MVLLQAAAIAMALSVDAFAAGFAYGSNQIKIPLHSALIITLISSGVTGLSLLVGSVLQHHIAPGLTTAISVTILLALGILKLLDSITKSIIRTHTRLNRELQFSLLNFRFIIHLYADPEGADVNRSQTLDPAEAVSLALALSLDGVAVGLGAALAGISVWAIFLSSLGLNMLCLLFGDLAGGRLARKSPCNLSCLGGAILIALAIWKLL